jgi:hypothetical protein
MYMERPIKTNIRQSLADVLLCMIVSTNAELSSFPVSKLVIIVPPPPGILSGAGAGGWGPAGGCGCVL